MITTESKTISIKRTFELPLSVVWKAFTDPEDFKKWWGPKNYRCTHSDIDFRVGGKYLNCMLAKDGKAYWSTGRYKEIIPQRKIVVTDSFSDSKGNIIPASSLRMPGDWPLELTVTLEFDETEGKTSLLVTHEGIPPEMHDECILGWQESLDKLENNFK